MPLVRRLLAEFIGTAMLLAAIVGSGIAAQRLSPHDSGLELLENAVATGAALVVIILVFSPLSGAHFNPVITLADVVLGGMTVAAAAGYVVAQLAGAVVGAVLANLMFTLPAVEISSQVRYGPGLWLAEGIATFGLVLVVFSLVRSGRPTLVASAVGLYIGAAYWFTASTSFANPAVTIARTLSDTFAGIAPGSVIPFILAQLMGAGVAVATVRFLYPLPSRRSSEGA